MRLKRVINALNYGKRDKSVPSEMNAKIAINI